MTTFGMSKRKKHISDSEQIQIKTEKSDLVK